MVGGADEGEERYVVEDPPGSLPDMAPDVEARSDHSRCIEGQLADPDRDGRVGRCEWNQDRAWAEVETLIEDKQRAVQRGQDHRRDGQVLVKGEADRAMGDRVQDLGREQQPVQDRGGQHEERQEAHGANRIPGQQTGLDCRHRADSLYCRRGGGAQNGAEHDGKAQPAGVNYDEAKVPAYVLPDPLRFADGRPVREAKDWHY